MAPDIESAVVTGGRIIYAVDHDTASFADLAELENGEISLGVRLRLIKTVDLFAVGNRGLFRKQAYCGYNDYI